MTNNTKFQYGMFGGALVVAVFIIILFSASFFNYRISINRIFINSINLEKSTVDTLKFENDDFRNQILFDALNKDKLILTPQEYTNNVVNYYNSLLLILSVMLGAFSILTFVYLKSQSKDLIQDGLQSEQFKNQISEILVGKAENRFREVFVELEDKLTDLENKISVMDQASIDQGGDIELEE